MESTRKVKDLQVHLCGRYNVIMYYVRFQSAVKTLIILTPVDLQNSCKNINIIYIYISLYNPQTFYLYPHNSL